MASKFGGVDVEDSGSKFGGVPVGASSVDATQPASASLDQTNGKNIGPSAPPSAWERFKSRATETLRTLPDEVLSGRIVPDTLNAIGPRYGAEFMRNPNMDTFRRAIPFVGAAEDSIAKPLDSFARGDFAGGAGDVADIGVNLLGGKLLHAPPDMPSMGRVSDVAGGAFDGAIKAATEKVPVTIRGHRFNVSAPIASGVAGAAAGHFVPFVGGDVLATAGGLGGAAAPIVRGAIEGGRSAGRLFDIKAQPTPARPVFDRPEWTPPEVHEPVRTYTRQAAVRAGNPELPSGRSPGGIHNIPPPSEVTQRESPLWMQYGAQPSAPPIYGPVDPIISDLPSGRYPVSARFPEEPSPQTPRVPMWKGIQATPMDDMPNLGAISNPLPSGRKVGGIHNSLDASVRPGGPSPQLMDELSVALTGKPLAKLSAGQQFTIADLASRGSSNGGVAPPMASTVEQSLPGGRAISDTPAAEPLPNPKPDYSGITKQYQPSRTRARFDKSGKRTGG